MALSPTIITQAVIAAGPDLLGPNWLRLAAVIGTGVFAWSQVPANLALQGVTTGPAGAGTVLGTITVVPNPLPVNAAFAAALLLGLDAASIARATGVGVATAFSSSGTYQGASAGVGTGSDVSKVTVANGPALVAAISTAATAAGLVGVNVPRLCAGLGSGIATLLLTGTGVGVVTGPVGPAPAVGTSISRVF